MFRCTTPLPPASPYAWLCLKYAALRSTDSRVLRSVCEDLQVARERAGHGPNRRRAVPPTPTGAARTARAQPSATLSTHALASSHPRPRINGAADCSALGATGAVSSAWRLPLKFKVGSRWPTSAACVISTPIPAPGGWQRPGPGGRFAPLRARASVSCSMGVFSFAQLNIGVSGLVPRAAQCPWPVCTPNSCFER